MTSARRLRSDLFTHRLLQANARLRRYAEELGDAPDEVVLEFVHLAVREDQLPHHCYDPLPLGFIEPALQHTGKAVEVDRFAVGGFGGSDKIVGIGVVEAEAKLEELAEFPALLVRHESIDRGRMEKERRR